MKLKTYHAPTLHAALRLARIELGSEAVLLEAKEREAETAEGRFQVTFALGVDGEPAAPPPVQLGMPHWRSYLGDRESAVAPAAPPPQKEPERPPKPKRRASRRAKTAPGERRKADQPSSATELPAAGALRTPDLAAIFGRLVAAGVTTTEAEALTRLASRAAGRDDDGAALETGLRGALDAGWRIHAVRAPEPHGTRVIALVGPAGAGKSATAVKAARLLRGAYGRRAALISLGRHPVGGVEALEAWSTLLNIRLEIVEAPERLPDALERLTAGSRPPGAVLVDTPADGSAAEALARQAGLETHLVLPAVYSPADLLRAAERFHRERIDAVVLTKLDEAAAPGVIWNFQRATDLPASFLGCGPGTPGDLQPATARRLTQGLLDR